MIEFYIFFISLIFKILSEAKIYHNGILYILLLLLILNIYLLAYYCHPAAQGFGIILQIPCYTNYINYFNPSGLRHFYSKSIGLQDFSGVFIGS